MSEHVETVPSIGSTEKHATATAIFIVTADIP